MQCHRRAGFSLIEALVVLAIGGMALAVIFSIGIKAGDSGFSLGRRAMAVADADVAVLDLRSLVRSMILRPTATVNDQLDRPLVGTAKRIEADVVIERATVCAPNGWAGRLILSIEVEDGRQVLNCQAGGRKTRLVTLPPGQEGRFAYSENRSGWISQYEAPPFEASIDGFKSQTLFVRLSAGPRFDVIESAYSSHPGLWTRPSADF